jgi:hypothetical protein
MRDVPPQPSDAPRAKAATPVTEEAVVGPGDEIGLGYALVIVTEDATADECAAIRGMIQWWERETGQTAEYPEESLIGQLLMREGDIYDAEYDVNEDYPA